MISLPRPPVPGVLADPSWLTDLRPRLGAVPPIWRETRTPLELARLRRDPIFRCEGVEHGEGRAVLLVPGFMAGDNSLGTVTLWLRRCGYRTRRAGIRLNVACSNDALDRLEACAEEMAERAGDRVAVVGQSRGGTLGRALAVRRPDLVAGVVALGSPLVDQLAVHPLVLLQVGVVGALGTLGVPGLFKQSCLAGECCEEYRALSARDFPDGVGFVSVYSRSDGIVDWRACLDPAADHVEIDGSHIGMGVHAGAYRAIAEHLGRFWREPPLARAA